VPARSENLSRGRKLDLDQYRPSRGG